MIANNGSGYRDHNMIVTPSNRQTLADQSFLANLSAKMKRGGMMTPGEAHYLMGLGYTSFGGVNLRMISNPSAGQLANARRAAATQPTVRYGM